jgi:hypothetical protein
MPDLCAARQHQPPNLQEPTGHQVYIGYDRNWTGHSDIMKSFSRFLTGTASLIISQPPGQPVTVRWSQLCPLYQYWSWTVPLPIISSDFNGLQFLFLSYTIQND